jgi:tRNA(Arg) A34 adenosine deaminase TadA
MATAGTGHELFMQVAIQVSETAGIVDKTDCFGAVVVKEGQIIGQGSNQVSPPSPPPLPPPPPPLSPTTPTG